MKCSHSLLLAAWAMLFIAPQAFGQNSDVFTDYSTEFYAPNNDVPEVVPEQAKYSLQMSDTELIQERYENRRVKIERQVTQDESHNYINHGSWKMWDREGRMLVEGSYDHDQRVGLWVRFYYDREAAVLQSEPFSTARPPFISQAMFTNDKLDGVWLIFDGNKTKLCQIEFANGQRNGLMTWWYPSGRKMREAMFVDGVISGELMEWTSDGQVAKRETYIDGRQLTNKTELYPDQSKRSEGSYLHAKMSTVSADDWWNLEFARFNLVGSMVKHGTWITWYQNGQRKYQGQYEQDKPTGQFTWWHPNGQKSLEARYIDGKEQGTWTWWHENGQKSVEGSYVSGHAENEWFWWADNGKLADKVNFSDPNRSQHVTAPVSDGDSILESPSASLPSVTELK